MKALCYTQSWCHRCKDFGTLRESPIDYKVHPLWVADWGLYRASMSKLIEDPEGRCIGCRSSRLNRLKVIPVFLHKLGVRFESVHEYVMIGTGKRVGSFGKIKRKL